MAFGYKPTFNSFASKTNENELMHQEIVDILILNIDYPYTYKKNLGANLLNHKDHGMTVNYAVVRRNRCDGPFEKVFLSDDTGTMIEPNYTVYGSFNQWTPKDVFSKYTFPQQGGSEKSVNLSSGKTIPKIIDLMPNPFVCRDRDSGVKANDIPPGFEAKYSKIIDEEKVRQKAWKEVLDYWEALTEEQAKQELLGSIAQRLLICNKLGGNESGEGVVFEYIKPQVGMLIRCQIERNAKTPKYFNLLSFAFNKENRQWDIFSTLDCKTPSEDLVKSANIISKIKEDNIKLRAINYKAKTTKVESVYTPEPGDPF